MGLEICVLRIDNNYNLKFLWLCCDWSPEAVRLQITFVLGLNSGTSLNLSAKPLALDFLY